MMRGKNLMKSNELKMINNEKCRESIIREMNLIEERKRKI